MLSPTLIEHFRNPRNVGELEQPCITVSATNPVCGDELLLCLSLEDGGVKQARFKTRGCAAAIAVGSFFTEFMPGRSAGELRGLNEEEIDRVLGGLPPESKHVARLWADALRLACDRIAGQRSL